VKILPDIFRRRLNRCKISHEIREHITALNGPAGKGEVTFFEGDEPLNTSGVATQSTSLH